MLIMICLPGLMSIGVLFFFFFLFFFFSFFFLMIRRPPRSTQSRSSAASDVYKRQTLRRLIPTGYQSDSCSPSDTDTELAAAAVVCGPNSDPGGAPEARYTLAPVSYTHLRAHETVLDLVCRLLLEKKKHTKIEEYTSCTTRTQ